MAKQMTFGVIVGNRGFFPDHLAKTGREEMLRVLETAGIRTISLTPEESKFGAVETPTEARLVRRSLPQASRRDRRRHCYTSQLRRRARDCRCAAALHA